MKNVILYGTDRLKKDFLYLFPKVKVVGNIALSRTEENECSNNICTINQISKSILKNRLLILCIRKDKKIDEMLNQNGLESKKDYYYFEDVAYMLNDNIDRQFRRYIWFRYKHNKEYGMYLMPFLTNQEMVKKMIYTDSVDGYRCTVPFNYMNIQMDGSAYSCCPRMGRI